MLGLGVYQLSEVARYTDLPPSTVRSWFKLRSDGAGHGPIFKSDYAPIDNDYAVSFLDLIEAYVARFFYKAGVKSALIRKAHGELQKEMGDKHPFANADLCTGGGRIIRDVAGELVDAVSRQHWFAEVKDMLSHVDYGDDGRASLWNIDRGVVINPQVAFGKPVAKGTGVTTWVLSNQYFANGRDGSLVAELYDVAESAVLDAVSFEMRINRGQAA